MCGAITVRRLQFIAHLGAPIDEEVDTEKLARQSDLTGGQIRDAAVRAAFLAASESSALTLKHITSAIQAELAKTGN